MKNFKNKTGQISKNVCIAIKNLAYNGIANTKKLSDLYASRSTSYNSIYDSELFVISREKEDIVAAGYSPLCKAIINLNETHPIVKEVLLSEKLKKEEKIVAENFAEEQKKQITKLILQEANSIQIDEDFKKALIWASEASGKEKSERMASAMKGLLERNNKPKIDTDFWQVFRILKSQTNIN